MTDFESLRDYVSGDDVRFVDWKAFAHRGRPMVRQYQVERGQELIRNFVYEVCNDLDPACCDQATVSVEVCSTTARNVRR